MKTAEDLETYMLQMGLDFERVDDGLWLVSDEADSLENIVIHLLPPVVTFSVKLFDLPNDGKDPTLLRRLLELNATDMLHGAYGIDGNSVIMIDSLQSENLDANEFQASLEAMSLSMIQHYPEIRALIHRKEVG